MQSKIFRAVKEKLKLQPEGYFYDVTSIYFYGIKCPIARRKKKRKSEDKPQIELELGLAVTGDHGVPVFHRVFEGNIFDAKTLPDILVAFQEHDIRDAFLIWDRGISSELNISEAKKAGFQVLCGLALKGDVKEVARKILEEEDFCSLKNRVKLRNATFYAKMFRYKYQGISGFLVICLNEKRKQEIKERGYDEISEAQALKNKKPSPSMRKYLIRSSPNYEAIREAETFDGASAIFCTRKLSVEEVIRAYFEKDRIEKAFRTMKGLLEMDKIRFWLTGKVKAHIFICYLSYLLLSLLDYKLRNTSVSAENALELLSSMYRVYISCQRTKNRFVKTVVLSKQQEKILKAVDKHLLKCSV